MANPMTSFNSGIVESAKPKMLPDDRIKLMTCCQSISIEDTCGSFGKRGRFDCQNSFQKTSVNLFLQLSGHSKMKCSSESSRSIPSVSNVSNQASLIIGSCLQSEHGICLNVRTRLCVGDIIYRCRIDCNASPRIKRWTNIVIPAPSRQKHK